jgi:excisionase family DNA binding protein
VTEETSGPVPVYLTAAEVAELLQVDEKTVSRWSFEDPSMPVLRRGRVVRFHRERLMLWLERQEPRGSRQVALRRRKADEPTRSTEPCPASSTAPLPPSAQLPDAPRP